MILGAAAFAAVPVAVTSVVAPSCPLAVPIMTIFVLPAGWFLVPPFAPMPRRLVVVAKRYWQQRSRDVRRGHDDPGTVVAGTGIPPTIGKRIVLAAVPKDVGRGGRGVVDRESWNARPLRGPGQIDPDVDVDLGLRGDRAHAGDGETTPDHSISHRASSSSCTI